MLAGSSALVSFRTARRWAAGAASRLGDTYVILSRYYSWDAVWLAVYGPRGEGWNVVPSWGTCWHMQADWQGAVAWDPEEFFS